MSVRDHIKRAVTKSASSPLTKSLKDGAQRLAQEAHKGHDRLKQRQRVMINTGRRALALNQRIAREALALNLTLTARGLTQLAALTQASRDLMMMTRAPLSPLALAELLHRVYGSPRQAHFHGDAKETNNNTNAEHSAADEPHVRGAEMHAKRAASAEDDELEVEFF